MGFEHTFIEDSNIKKAELTVQKMLYPDLVGGIQDSWTGSPLAECGVRKAQTREFLKIGLVELELADAGKIELGQMFKR